MLRFRSRHKRSSYNSNARASGTGLYMLVRRATVQVLSVSKRTNRFYNLLRDNADRTACNSTKVL